MTEFGKLPAFPMPAVYDPTRDQIHTAAQYGADTGLNIQQHVWLALFTAAISSSGDVSASAARAFAREHLDETLKHLEKLA